MAVAATLLLHVVYLNRPNPGVQIFPWCVHTLDCHSWAWLLTCFGFLWFSTNTKDTNNVLSDWAGMKVLPAEHPFSNVTGLFTKSQVLYCWFLVNSDVSFPENAVCVKTFCSWAVANSLAGSGLSPWWIATSEEVHMERPASIHHRL